MRPDAEALERLREALDAVRHARGRTIPRDVLARLEAIVIQRGLPEVGPLDAYLVWARSTIDPKDVRGVALLRQLERVRRLVGE